MAATPGMAAGIEPALREALAVPGWRVRRLDLPAGRVWVKRVEQTGLRLRLQKGDPRRGLEAERQGLRLLRDAGMPVVALVAEGPDWIAVPDAGPDLRALLWTPEVPDAERERALVAAARALARLHARGFAHGRLVLRDICWDGTTARFIDLERFPGGLATRRQQAIDVLCLVQSWFTAVAEPEAALDRFFAEYRAAAGDAGAAVLQRTGQLARRSSWLGWAARLAVRLRPQSREAAAVPLALAWMRRHRT